MAGGLVTIAVSAAIVATVSDGAVLDVAGPDVRLLEVATVSVPNGAQAPNPVVARLPTGAISEAVPRSQLADLIRRAVPGLMVKGTSAGEVTLRRQSEPAIAAKIDCLEMQTDLAESQPLKRSDVDHVLCDAGRRLAKTIYDAGTGSVLAGQDLHRGDYLGHVLIALAPIVRRGQKLTLRSQVGPVLIERPVVAMQTSSKPGAVFVRADDGTVFAAGIATGARQ